MNRICYWLELASDMLKLAAKQQTLRNAGLYRLYLEGTATYIQTAKDEFTALFNWTLRALPESSHTDLDKLGREMLCKFNIMTERIQTLRLSWAEHHPR